MANECVSMTCDLYKSAFSGEVVFAVGTISGETYEGIAPKHYATPNQDLSADSVSGRVKVHMIANGGGTARVRMPDGEAIDVPVKAIDLSG